MYYLVDNELESFIKKYFSIWRQDILAISCIEYENFKRYTVNEHYILIIKN